MARYDVQHICSEFAVALVPLRSGEAAESQFLAFDERSVGRGCLELYDAIVVGGDDGPLSVECFVVRGQIF